MRLAGEASLLGQPTKMVVEGGIEDVVVSLSPGLTHWEIAADLEEVYGAEVSKQTITIITDRVMEGIAEWQSRPLDPVYAVLFIDAINRERGYTVNLMGPKIPASYAGAGCAAVSCSLAIVESRRG